MSDEKKLPVGRIVFDKDKESKSSGEVISETIEINSPRFVPLSEYEQAQQRIQELESALLAIRGLVQIKASTMIHSFARGDVLRIIDKALSEDSDDG